MKRVFLILIVLVLCGCRKDYNNPMNGNSALINLVGKYKCYVIVQDTYYKIPYYPNTTVITHIFDSTYYDTVSVDLVNNDFMVWGVQINSNKEFQCGSDPTEEGMEWGFSGYFKKDSILITYEWGIMEDGYGRVIYKGIKIQ